MRACCLEHRTLCVLTSCPPPAAAMVGAAPADVEHMRNHARMVAAAAEAAFERLEAERRTLRPRPMTASPVMPPPMHERTPRDRSEMPNPQPSELHTPVALTLTLTLTLSIEGCVQIPLATVTEWKAGKDQVATATEVLVVALLIIRSSAQFLDWVEKVLESQGSVEEAAGEQWAPPRHCPLWTPLGPLLGAEGLAGATANVSRDQLRAIVVFVAEWVGDGATEGELPASDIKKWIELSRNRDLRGPRRGKTEGAPRHIGAAVRVARLLRDQGGALVAAYNQAYERLDAEAPSTECNLTKAELISNHADQVGATAAGQREGQCVRGCAWGSLGRKEPMATGRKEMMMPGDGTGGAPGSWMGRVRLLVVAESARRRMDIICMAQGHCIGKCGLEHAHAQWGSAIAVVRHAS